MGYCTLCNMYGGHSVSCENGQIKTTASDSSDSPSNFLAVVGKKHEGWICEMFGSGQSFVWEVPDDKVPNRFWRFMQYTFFGNKWIKPVKEK